MAPFESSTTARSGGSTALNQTGSSLFKAYGIADTFKQSALVSRPKDDEEDEVATKFLNNLAALDEMVKDIQVLVIRNPSYGIEDFITNVRKVTNKSSSTFIVDTAEDLRILVHVIAKTGLAASPCRIQAYPNQFIRVIYSTSDNLTDHGVLQDIEETTLASGDDGGGGGGGGGGEGYYIEDDDDDDWDSVFTLTVRDPLGMGDVLNEHIAIPADLYMPNDVLASSIHKFAHATTTPFVLNTSANQLLPTNSYSTSVNQAVQTFRFTLPPPPRHLPSDILGNNACLEVSYLDSTPKELAEERSFMPQYIFILPQGWTSDTQIISIAEAPCKLFRMCVYGLCDPEENIRVAHLLDEPRPQVRDPLQFIDLFATTLLLGTNVFLASLRASQGVTDAACKSRHTYSFSDPRQAVEHIHEELGLPGVDAAVTLLEQMIKYLEEVLLPRQGAADIQPSSTSGNPTLERSRLSLNDMKLLSMYVDFGHLDTPSAYLNFDKDGNDLWVCHHHYRCLDPGFQRNHVKRSIKRFGQYDAATGRIDAHLRTPKDLAVLCGIDPVKAARVSELNVGLDWRISPTQLKQLVKWVKNLDLTTLSVTGTKGEGGPSSAAPRSEASVVEEMNEVRIILRHTVNQLKRVTLTWDSELDASALLQDVSPLRDSLLYFKIKTGRQEVSSVMFKGHLGIDYIKSNFGDLPIKSGGSFLAGRIQSMTIGPNMLTTLEEQATAWRSELSSAIQENRALTSLTINCNAQDFNTILDNLRSILCELHNPLILRQSLHFITLKDSHNQTTARFNITPLAHENRTIVDVAAGKIGPAHHSVILEYGASIRVLNVLDGHIESGALLRDFAYAKPTRLVSLMLALDRFSYQYGNDLSAITTSSKDTLKQLVLIGHPRSNETLSLLLDTINSLHGCDVLVTRTGSASIKTWIKRIQEVIQKSCRLIVVKSAEEMRLLVPELSTSGSVSLKRSFERNQYFIVKRKKTDPIEGEYEDEVIDYGDEVIEYGPDGHYML
ncbi:hypothetical protein BGX24_005955 [Mortierella sp. AD032]|nr:hypothetical protein BGX24_005955 [Mortierella sp. AD032]